ncbi:MAG: Hpt domain-containing protein [Desulfobulbaceae bacterium]|nr:Hpt domain-containing protein [Desulfobulbaceae bacterium]
MEKEKQHYLETMQRHLEEYYLLDKQQVVDAIPGFLATLFKHMHSLGSLQQEGDLVALAKASHAVRGALLNLGLFDLAEFTRQVEEQCCSPTGQSACHNLLAELNERLLPLKDLLQSKSS